MGGRAEPFWVTRVTACGIAAAIACVLALSVGTSASRAEGDATPEATTGCGRGTALEGLGLLGQAEGAYLEDLKTQESLKCGEEGLRKLGKAEAACAAARALEGSGQKAKAKEAYVKALEADPGATCATTALAATPDSSEGFWTWMTKAAEDALGVLGFVLLALAGVAAVVWSFLFVQMSGRRSRKRWPARRLLRPSLELKALDDTALTERLGASITSLIRSRVKPRRAGGIDIVTGHSALSTTLAPLGDISSQAKAAVAVVSFLSSILPRRQYEVSGALQKAGAHGEGISLELTNRSVQLGSTTLWGHEYGSPTTDVDAYQQLAAPAAAWLDHRIATAMEEGDGLPEDPRSWTLYRAGAAWQEEGDLAKAKGLYEAALALGYDNLWAMANLGGIALVEGEYPQALQLLTDALDALERISG